MAYQTVKEAMKAMADQVRETFFPPGYSEPLTLNQIVNIVLDKNVKISSVDEGLKLIADAMRNLMHMNSSGMTIPLELIILTLFHTDVQIFEDYNTWPLYTVGTPAKFIPNKNLEILNDTFHNFILHTHLKKVGFNGTTTQGIIEFEKSSVRCYLIGDPAITGKIYAKKIDGTYELDAILRVPRGTSSQILKQGMAIEPKNSEETMVIGDPNRGLTVRLINV